MLRKDTTQLILAIALMATTATAAAHNKVVVIPLGDDAPTSKTIFFTATEWPGDLGGAAGADQKCQAEANVSGSLVKGKQFKAWISGPLEVDDISGPRHFTYYGLPYISTVGRIVSFGFSNLQDDHSLENDVANQFGILGNLDPFWTGTDIDGVNSPSRDCLDWHSSNSLFLGEVGVGHRAVGLSWRSFGDTPRCDSRAALLCLEQ